MNSKTIEGLVGVTTNMNMLEVPMRIYRQAERRGDLGAMERAGKYITEFSGRKDEYREEVEEGMELEKIEKREEEKEKQSQQTNTEDAASLCISEEGKEAWLQAAESASGEEVTDNENRGTYTECAGAEE